MPPSLLERFKPAARARTHLLAAAVLWTIVGTGLAAAGVFWCLDTSWPWPLILVTSAGGLGYVKARYALQPMARRNANRILERGDERCLGGFVSWRTWLFIIAMMLGGQLLRRSPIPVAILGLVYATVGSALVLASLALWQIWRRARQPA
jgi:hypothetical protein